MKTVNPTNLPAIAFVDTVFVDGYRAVGTATLIGPQLLLTAGHVVYDRYRVRDGQAFLAETGTPSSITVTLGGGSGGSRFNMKAASWRSTPTWVNEQSGAPIGIRIRSAFDVGAIILPEPVDARVGGVFIPQTTPGSELVGMQLDVAGFSAKQFFQPPLVPPTQMLVSAADNLHLLPDYDYRLIYSVETVAGMSGGPVWSYDAASGNRTIRAIHTALMTDVGGSALRITDDVMTLINQWITQTHPAATA